MPRRRASLLVGFVVVLAVVQVAVEDVIVFLAATGTVGPAVLNSPFVLIGLPFALFLLLAGALFAWALTGERSRP